MPKTIFLDTGTFIHYQYFDQIDWREVVQADTVTILIPPITIRELNKLKDSHPRSKIRARAATAQKKLSALFADSSETQLRDGVVAQLEDRDSLIDFQAYHLSREIQDDHLIASIIMCRDEQPDAEIVLVTSDAGLTLMAKARRHKIDTIKLPDNFKIAEELDPEQEKILALEKEIRELKLKVPVLSLAFEDCSQRAKFLLPQPVPLTPEEVQRNVDAIKQQYPKKQTEPKSTDKRSKSELTLGEISAMTDLAGIFDSISPADITRYNTELDKFYASYVKYLTKQQVFENLMCRTIKLEIFLVNDGTAPAEDIDIFMDFPDGFILRDEGDFPEPPYAPKPPDPPRTMLDSWRISTEVPYLGSLLSHPNPVPPTSPNVSSPNIRRTNRYEVNISVRRVKHKLQAPFDPVYVTFDSLETASSFHVDYEILAANIPDKTPGQLHIIVEKESGA